MFQFVKQITHRAAFDILVIFGEMNCNFPSMINSLSSLYFTVDSIFILCLLLPLLEPSAWLFLFMFHELFYDTFFTIKVTFELGLLSHSLNSSAIFGCIKFSHLNFLIFGEKDDYFFSSSWFKGDNRHNMIHSGRNGSWNHSRFSYSSKKKKFLLTVTFYGRKNTLTRYRVWSPRY